MHLNQRVENYLKAGYPGLFLVTHEEARIEALCKEVATSAGYKLLAWSCTAGLADATTGERAPSVEDDGIDAVLKAIAAGSINENSIVLLRDLHGWFADANPYLVRLLRDALTYAKTSAITLVMSGCEFTVPREVEKLVVKLDFELPDRETLKRIIHGLCVSNSKPLPMGAAMEAILDAACGMTTTEAEDAFALSFVEEGMLSQEVIYREKSNCIRKSELLELIESKFKIEDIGGLENLKADLISKRHLFTKAARDYGIPSPRGILVAGQPGTGKSLAAQATGSLFGVPQLRLEAGKLFGSLVGQTESNWRATFSLAKAVAPCVLWIDEVDGLFSGSHSSGQTDGGTTSRVIKSILQDMQFNGEGIFFVFTANDIDALPDPLIDRLDVWSVDLPTMAEREAIWAIQIARKREGQQHAPRNPDDFSLPSLAAATEGFSGRQIEQVWLAAIARAFNEQREPETADGVIIAGDMVATSKMMAEVIEARRKRLQGRSRPASAAEPTQIKATGTRKIAA